jgi:hypothetical protein
VRKGEADVASGASVTSNAWLQLGPLVALLALTGCQKGWLTTYLHERGASAKSATPLTMINGTDCPDGLARCIGGAVEVSHVARIPRPCSSPAHPEDCQCPWEAVENCPLGCVESGTEVVVPPDRAAARLCAPDPANPPARAVVGGVAPPGACEGAGFRCIGSVVVACTAGPDGGVTASVLAACVRGCFQEGEVLGEEEADPEAATRILCARGDRR